MTFALRRAWLQFWECREAGFPRPHALRHAFRVFQRPEYLRAPIRKHPFMGGRQWPNL